jgi:hypothetical protein
MCQNSNTESNSKEIEIVFMKKLRLNKIWEMLADILFRAISLPVSSNMKIYKFTILLLFFIYAELGLILKEETRLKVFQNRVLR